MKKSFRLDKLLFCRRKLPFCWRKLRKVYFAGVFFLAGENYHFVEAKKSELQGGSNSIHRVSLNTFQSLLFY